jgi:predicted nucleic acid-binding protein
MVPLIMLFLIKVKKVENTVAVDSMAINLDRGESETIILATEINDLLIN